MLSTKVYNPVTEKQRYHFSFFASRRRDKTGII